ncbi:MAG: DEAD/DEAH box helicase, partial [Victivallales bacterium]|nr:DEAD/DEAH box helicase [Victivallales bacterium]
MILEQTQNFFGPDSPLREGHGKRKDFSYEPRPQQVEMAEAIGAAFDAGENLCVEAPTGVGKTFAYLVPAVFQAILHDQPVLVSTHTIHLQEQILQRDIPFLEDLIGQQIKATVAKGRSNYLCLRKLNELADMDQEMLPGADVLDDIAKLVKWAETTETGDQGDMTEAISPALWDSVCSERGNCMGNQCPFFANCYLFKARRRIGNARVIVTNHAFFFSALAMEKNDLPESEKSENRLLPDLSAVIIDEAHTLEDCAANHLAVIAESFVIKKTLNRLFSRERGKGVLADPSFGNVQEVVNIAKHKADVFFTRILQWLEPQDKNPLRYTIPNHIPNYLDEPLADVVKALDELMVRLEDEELKAEIKGLRQTLDEQRIAMNIFFGMTENEFVYWMEIQGKTRQDLAFYSVPVNVAPLLREKLFGKPPV